MPTIGLLTGNETARSIGHQLSGADVVGSQPLPSGLAGISRRTVHTLCFRLIEQDPDDNKFVDCAITAGTDYIVSEDAHFRVLEQIPFPKVCVVRLQQFVKEMTEL